MTNLYWAGMREDEIAACAQLFDGSITFIGSNDGATNLAYLAEFPDDDYNYPNSRQYAWFFAKICEIAAKNSQAKFLFYNETTFWHSASRDEKLAKKCLILNSRESVFLCADKFACYKIFDKIVLNLPRKYLTGAQIAALDFAKPLVAQARYGLSGNGTFLLAENSARAILPQLNAAEIYAVSEYQTSNVPINIHAMIAPNKTILFPPSEQIIKLENNRLCYEGADFAKFLREVSAATCAKVKDYTVKICEKLREFGYRGILGIDFIVTGGGIYFMEINGRFQASSRKLSEFLRCENLPTLQELQLKIFRGEKISDDIISRIGKVNVG